MPTRVALLTEVRRWPYVTFFFEDFTWSPVMDLRPERSTYDARRIASSTIFDDLEISNLLPVPRDIVMADDCLLTAGVTNRVGAMFSGWKNDNRETTTVIGGAVAARFPPIRFHPSTSSQNFSCSLRPSQDTMTSTPGCGAVGSNLACNS